MVDAIVNEIERNEDVPLACNAKEFTCNCGIPVSWWGREEDPEGFLLHIRLRKSGGIRHTISIPFRVSTGPK